MNDVIGSDAVREEGAATYNLMTATEYLTAEGLPEHTELVKGTVIEMNQPSPLHGRACFRIAFELGKHAETHDCGRVLTNDSGIRTTQSPDTIRGADVSYCSFERLPKDSEVPDDYSGPTPEIVFEVFSKNDRWSDTYSKIGEYLNVDVQVVVIVDPRNRTARVFRPDGTDLTLAETDSVTIPEIKPTFEIKVSKLFA